MTAVATVGAMVAFAANSLLCRLALGPGTIDAATFTAVRLVSGAAVLLVVSRATGRVRRRGAGSWRSGALLFVYAFCFSLAYLELTVATGALILFGSVQLTMLLVAVARGERPRPRQWLGLGAALGGFVYLVSPGLAAPPLLGSGLMTASGAAWGVYTLRGRGGADPVAATSGNFVRSLPFVLVAAVVMAGSAHAAARGLVLAVLSGALTSGLGYVIWYQALRGLTATRAAGVQLTVPLIAAAAGVTFMSEAVSLRLAVATVAILGGVALVLAGRDGAAVGVRNLRAMTPPDRVDAPAPDTTPPLPPDVPVQGAERIRSL
ncbi:MAG: DMT family transporter, partial [Candidatus Krumholzibacteriia bacterium]